MFDGLVNDGVERTKKFEAMYRLAQEENCDTVILTGDIIDAPSEGNFGYLEKRSIHLISKRFFA